MSGGTLLPVVAVILGVAAANVALAWLLARREWEPPELLDSARYSPPSESGTDAGDPDTAATAGPDFAAGADSDPAGSRADSDDAPPPLDFDGETVACRHCGAENRPEFRYCRWCVRSGFAADGAGAGSGSAMTDRSL
jgi:hypothetical protein